MIFLVFDCGLYSEQANALAEGGNNRVFYYTPWTSKDPHYKDYVIGKGFEYLEKILYFEDYIEMADAVVFFDVHGNSYCNYLRKLYPKKSIWGAGLGERIENDRVALKKWCAQFGLPVNKYEVVKGVKKLREYLKSNKDKYIKINIFRGDMESFYAKDLDSVEMILDEVESALGPHKDEYDFIVEDAVKTDVEIGVDTIFNGTDYVGGFCGYELHKNLYLAHTWETLDDLPEPLEETLSAFQPLFQKMNYRGAMSTEEKVVSPTEHYFLDACMRLPNPLSALYPVMIENWAEVVYKVGLGEPVDLDIRHKYVGAFALTSRHCKDSYVKVDINKNHRDQVRYQMICGRKDMVYTVPGWEIAGIVIAGGNTVDEVLEKLKGNIKYIDGHGIDKDPIHGIDMIKEVIEKGKTVGIPFK